MNDIICGDSLKEETYSSIPDNTFHSIITSPPYFNLRDYGIEGQIGLEETPDEYISKMVKVFSYNKRILRDDGVFYLNIGDCYNGSGKAGKNKSYQSRHTEFGHPSIHKERFGKPTDIEGLKPKDMIGIPWMMAFALRKDGWFLRDAIIWNKVRPMPTNQTDRCTSSYEYIFQLTKSKKYYYDYFSIMEPTADGKNLRTRRNIWSIPTQPCHEAHFATFPIALVEPLLLSSASTYGCCSVCGKPYERILSKEYTEERSHEGRTHSTEDQRMGKTPVPEKGWESIKKTIGWAKKCDCSSVPVPCRVFDPFMGAGTVGVAAKKYGMHYSGIELNPSYIDIANSRINRTYISYSDSSVDRHQLSLDMW